MLDIPQGWLFGKKYNGFYLTQSDQSVGILLDLFFASGEIVLALERIFTIMRPNRGDRFL